MSPFCGAQHTSGVTPADLLAASMTAEAFSSMSTEGPNSALQNVGQNWFNLFGAVLLY